MARVRRRDFIGGMFLVLVGAGFAVAAQRHPFGTMARFGAGFFPFWLGVLLAGLGAILAVSSLFGEGADEPGFATMDLRSFAAVIGSVAVFGVILTKLGLLLSVIVLVLVSSLGSREFSLAASVGTALLMAVGCCAVFVYGLALAVPVLPAAFE